MSSPGFAQVEMRDVSSSNADHADHLRRQTPAGLIEITLPGGASVRVDARVDERALRRVFRVLREQ